jgi:hypothetical protein
MLQTLERRILEESLDFQIAAADTYKNSYLIQRSMYQLGLQAFGYGAKNLIHGQRKKGIKEMSLGITAVCLSEFPGVAYSSNKYKYWTDGANQTRTELQHLDIIESLNLL